MSDVPTIPLVPGLSANPGLPDDARRLLERGRVPFADACAFLGVGRTAGYTMARRYVRRTAKLVKDGRPFNAADLRPERDKDGRWREIPCYEIGGKYMARSDLLIEMVYPEARP
jgi:hypothetical protein